MGFSWSIRLASFFSLLAVVVSDETPANVNVAELLEKIEMQEAKLQQQSKLADLVALVEKRIENMQKFQISRVRPIEQRIEEAEQKLLGFVKLPELMSQLEARMETVVQLEAEHILPVEERINKAYQKLRVCSDIDEAVGKLEGCVNKITQEEKIVERVEKLEKNVTSLREEAAALATSSKRARAETQIKIDLFTVQAQKISSLEARLQEIETQQAKQENLPDLIDLYSTRQGGINKLYFADMAAVQEKLKKAEQKLLEYSSLPELFRQLEIRVKAQQANALDRISMLETKVSSAPQEKALQQKLAAIEQTQRNFTHLIDDLEESFKDLSKKHTSSISTLTSLNEEVGKCKGLPNKVTQLEKDFKSKIDDSKKSVSSLSNQHLQLGKDVTSLRQAHNVFESQFNDSIKSVSTLTSQHGQLGKDVTSLRQAQNDFKSQFDDIKKSVSSLKDQHLQLTKKIGSSEQGHKDLQNQMRSHQSQTVSALEKKLTSQLNDVVQRVTTLTGRLQQDVSSLQKADKDLEKKATAPFKEEKLGERVSALERSSAVIANETTSLNETIKLMMFNDLLQVGNITLLRFLLDLTQNEIRNDVKSLKEADQKLEKQLQDYKTELRNDVKSVKQADQKLEKQLQEYKTELKSHQNNANKLKQLENAISRHDGLFKTTMSTQNKDVEGRLTILEGHALAGKKERAILYDNIQQTTGDLRKNEGQTKSQGERLSSLNNQYLNLSVGLKDLAAQVRFLHSDFSLDGIVDVPKRRTALHVAAIEGKIEQVAYLLRNGADSELKDYKKWRPLHLAAWQGHAAVVRELLASGAKVDPVDEFGYTPLHWAAQYGREACAELLLDTDANLEARDLNDETPLHKATWDERTKMVELLLKRGAKVNAYRKEHYTALHLAAQKGHLPCVKVLVMKGADLLSRTIDGYTPLDIAVSNKHLDVINYLMQRT